MMWKLNLPCCLDHKANQELLASMLRQQNHNYEIVENGQDAVNIAETKEYDIILMVRHLSQAQSCLLHFSFPIFCRSLSYFYTLLLTLLYQDCNMPIMDGWQVCSFHDL